uniref:Thioredoxin domain-containing protein n=2 Tax=Lygus hesperus TaxID=30085 RepID=A0A0K8S9L4_LYGHE
MKLSVVAESLCNDDVIPSKKEPAKTTTMFIVFRELCFIFAVFFTAYATFINTQPKVQRGAPPSPFFLHSSIRDFYQGDLTQLMQEITHQHYAFVMYYAPWDADSQDAKDDFIEASLFYGDKVYFAGVNCWEPSSECRLTFKEVISPFPQLVAYVGPGKAVEYKGPHTADHLIKFLHSVLHPVVRVNSAPELWDLRTIHDAVLVGHLNFHGVISGLGYQILYDTALRLASRDHERHIAVGVFTHLGVNRLLGLDEKPTIVLYLWNQRMEYQGKADVDSLIKWVMAQVEKGLPELNSNTLLPHMKGGAVMVMFTPRHPLASIIPYYHLLRRIAMNFNFCRNGTRTHLEDDFFSYVLQYKSLYPSGYERGIINAEGLLRQKCKVRRKMRQTVTHPCNSPTISKWDNMTCFSGSQQGFCRTPSYTLKIMEFSPLSVNEYSSDAERVREAHLDEKCALLERSPLPIAPKDSPYIGRIPTSCETNKTFSFIALDSSSYTHLANGLGLQLPKMKHRTSVVIFDNEEVLKLNTTEVTEKSVADLLRRYLAGERQRPLRSATDTINFHNSIKDKQEGEVVDLTELNTHTFDSFALNQSQNVVVMYHSPYCSFCLTLSNLFLSLAYFLRQVRSLSFARIDGELNDLPWQYTVPTYPSVIFFPAHRKSESRIFPHKLPLNMHSLASFIISNLRNYERMSVMLALCSRWGQNPMATSEGEMCLKDIRMVSIDGISDMLREYRSYLLRIQLCASCPSESYLNLRLKSIFRVLEYLKTAHLHLYSVTNISYSVSYLENMKSRIITH